MGELRIEQGPGGGGGAHDREEDASEMDVTVVVFRCVVPTANGRKEISLNLRRAR